ncbi:MAG: hypothetical protein E7632_11595, partial [Ruminococcaceae bacterium]|nr:hypothetical protein [Oscillospiraceae bacterium]
YNDPGDDFGLTEDGFSHHFDGQTLSYAVIPGLGEEADYEGIDVVGKLALISRGVTTFVEKVNIAAAHGAVGAIIYNNEDGEFSMDLTDAAIPAIAITKADGELLASQKTRTLRFERDFIRYNESGTAGQISDFSSWGTTPSLTLKPDIAGVGGSVLSTVPGGGFGGLSGTSMSAPQLSGIAALMTEKLNDDGITIPTAYPTVIRTTLMNTAVPILQENGAETSPRAQGAGLVNAKAALDAALRLTYTFNDKPKAELSDLIGDTAYLDVKLQNLTHAPLTVTVGVTLTSDGYTELTVDETTGYFSTLTAEADTTSRIMSDDHDGNLNKNAADYSPLTLTLAAGEVRKIPLTVHLDEDYHDALDEIFTSGHFVEGYVYCEADGVSYSMPYMGYRGDWSHGSVLDASYYGDGFSLFGGTLFATHVPDSTVVLEVPDGADIAFSPNGDGYADVLAFGAIYIRNIKGGTMTIRDEAGEVIYTRSIGPVTKTIGYGLSAGFELGWEGDDGFMARYRFPDGLYTITFTYTLDFRSGMTQSHEYTVRIDTEAPVLTDLSLEDGVLTVAAEDVSGIKAIVILEHDGEDAFQESVTDADKAEFDLSGFDGDTLYYEIIDYALNTRVGKLSVAELAK